MVATILHDTWYILNMQQISPNSQIWDYYGILKDETTQPYVWSWPLPKWYTPIPTHAETVKWGTGDINEIV